MGDKTKIKRMLASYPTFATIWMDLSIYAK